ncbi:MAG: T9SS type A sorting domain-containing protein, partial [Flavobacteriales bacterium]
ISSSNAVQESADILIGRREDNSGANPANPPHFEGKIDDVKIYDCALDSSDVDSMWKAGCAPRRDTINPSACDTYTVPSGDETYTTTGTYHDTLKGNYGCDSIIRINLTINSPDSTVTQSNDTLVANETGASYQWLDCDSGNSAIGGAAGQNFMPSSDGNYAVEVTKNGCTDTSLCHNVTLTTILENELGSNLKAHPNPTRENITINLGEKFEEIKIKIRTISGKTIDEHHYRNRSEIKPSITGPSGVYMVEVTNDDGERAVLKVVKER